jgi:hypothetical protein
MSLAALLCASLAQGAATNEPAAGASPENIPMLVRDESAPDWVVDRFAGNSTAGDEFYQGPARQVGGLNRPGASVQPDGSVALFMGKSVCVVATNGIIELVRQDGYFSPIEGQMEAKQGGNTAVLEGKITKYDCVGDFYDAAEKAYYSIQCCCIRKATEQPDGSLLAEVVAGTPYKSGSVDGPGKSALLVTGVRGTVRFADGTLYWSEFPKNCVRKFKDGQVSTLTLKFKDPPDRLGYIMSLGKIVRAEDENSLLIVDGYNFLLRRLDLKTLEVTNLAGVNPAQTKNVPASLKKRFNPNADGPALTHVFFNSGLCSATWDPFYKVTWLGGPDESNLRWLKDGWVKTVIGSPTQPGGWDSNALGVPAPRVNVAWAHVVGTDSRGGVYFINGGNQTGIWRAHNPKEGGK